MLAPENVQHVLEHANRIMDFRDKFGEDKVIDVHYADLLNDPVGETKKLYAKLGDAWTPPKGARIGVVVCGANCDPGSVVG